MEIDLQCGGVNLTDWLRAGAAGRSAALAAFAAGRLPGDWQLWQEHLVYCASGCAGESRLFVRKEGEWRFPALAPAEERRRTLTSWWMAICWGCRSRCCTRCRKAVAPG
ncbi:hypothetical protein MJ560_23015 [Klebsiella pneumoniae]|nr:hypothetical protein MJ560_23015 [Klebsiella pneumoniae]